MVGFTSHFLNLSPRGARLKKAWRRAPYWLAPCGLLGALFELFRTIHIGQVPPHERLVYTHQSPFKRRHQKLSHRAI